MCAIIAWNGRVPKGLLTHLLVESQHRGSDSTGIAFRVQKRGSSEIESYAYRVCSRATEFVRDRRHVLSEARKSPIGIAHVRRASPGMPIDEVNAHPFGYWRIYFAHNGRIENWKQLKPELVKFFEDEIGTLKQKLLITPNDTYVAQMLAQSQLCLEYCQSSQTDSKILGPFIHSQNFSRIEGSVSLVWMQEETVTVFRQAKEAVAATVIWRSLKDPSSADSMVTLVTSTQEILTKALDKTKDIEFDIQWQPYNEGIIYQVNSTGLQAIKRTSIKGAIEDAWSSMADTQETSYELNAQLEAETNGDL